MDSKTQSRKVGVPLGAPCICPVCSSVFFSITNLYIPIFTYQKKKAQSRKVLG